MEVPKIGERVYYFPQGHMEQVIHYNLLITAQLNREEFGSLLKFRLKKKKLGIVLFGENFCVLGLAAGGVDESGTESADSVAVQSPFQDSLQRC